MQRLSFVNKRSGFLAALILSVAMGTPSLAQTSAYVSNIGNGTVSVIDVSNNTVTATISVGDSPRRLAATPDGSRVYVPNKNSGTVSVIDTANNTVTATIPVGAGPQSIVVTPDGARAYVTHFDSNNVLAINTATNAVTATIPIGSGTNDVAVTSDGTRVYVSAFSNSLSVIDTATNTVTATIAGITNPRGVRITPDGTRVYVGSPEDGNVAVIDTATNTVTTTIPRADAVYMAITPNGARLYVAGGTTSVDVIDTSTNTIITSIPIGSDLGSTSGIAITADGSKAYVAVEVSGAVLVIDTATNTVTAGVTTGNPFGVAIATRSTTPPVPKTLKFFLHGNDIPKTAGGFTMNETPGPNQILAISVLSSVKWFSDPALSGTFASDATFKLTFPCAVGLGVLTTFKLETAEPNGSAPQALGQRTELLSVCVGSRTIPIPVTTPVTLANKRLKLTIENVLGVNLNLQLGSGTFLEATKFTSAP